MAKRQRRGRAPKPTARAPKPTAQAPKPTLDTITTFIINLAMRGGGITHGKLQLILFYVQAVSLAQQDQPRFDEDFVADGQGPLLRSVQARYGHHGTGPIASPGTTGVLPSQTAPKRSDRSSRASEPSPNQHCARSHAPTTPGSKPARESRAKTKRRQSTSEQYRRSTGNATQTPQPRRQRTTIRNGSDPTSKQRRTSQAPSPKPQAPSAPCGGHCSVGLSRYHGAPSRIPRRVSAMVQAIPGALDAEKPPAHDRALSANMTETPASFGITVGRWR